MIAIGIALLGVACGADPPPAHDTTAPGDANSRPHVFAIVIDATSAAYLGCYGGNQPTSPEIDRFARDAVVFEQAYSQTPTTLTSTASLLTGRRGISDPVLRDGRLRDDLPVLPELLSRAGFATRAIVANPSAGAPELGLDRGYDEVSLVYTLSEARARDQREFHVASPVEVERVAVESVRRIAASAGTPAFTYVHFLQPHVPYDPPAELRHPFIDSTTADWTTLEPLFRKAKQSGHAAPETVAAVEAHYRANLRYVDASVGRLFDALRETGLYDASLVILTSDHGDAFFAHGTFGHNTTLFDDMTRIPLLVKFPAREAIPARRLPDLVETVDLTATLLDYLGVGSPEGIDGETFWPLVSGRVETLDRQEVVTSTSSRALRAIRVGDYKLVRSGFGEALYDLAGDPDEQADVSGERPSLKRILSTRLEAVAPQRWVEPASLDRLRVDPEQAALLEALGYADGPLDAE